MGTFETEEQANFACDGRIEQLRSSFFCQETNSPKDADVPSLPQPEAPHDGLLGCEKARMVWDQLAIISQRLLLAKAVRAKLTESQALSVSYSKDALLKSLNEEVVILTVAKTQLEEALETLFIKETTMSLN
ncbi:hypothetical protein EON64_04105 [archaeon]|nr:MAG: hypothetical protein EON64_04105 [archaeon]